MAEGGSGGSRTGSLVYAVRAGGYVKIGTTRDLEGRMQALQTGSPKELRLIGWAEGDRRLERALHLQFAAQRRVGEWFDLSAALEKVLLGRLAGEPHVVQLPKATRAAMARKNRRRHVRRLNAQMRTQSKAQRVAKGYVTPGDRARTELARRQGHL